jgi:hypothetical protein
MMLVPFTHPGLWNAVDAVLNGVEVFIGLASACWVLRINPRRPLPISTGWAYLFATGIAISLLVWLLILGLDNARAPPFEHLRRHNQRGRRE